MSYEGPYYESIGAFTAFEDDEHAISSLSVEEVFGKDIEATDDFSFQFSAMSSNNPGVSDANLGLYITDGTFLQDNFFAHQICVLDEDDGECGFGEGYSNEYVGVINFNERVRDIIGVDLGYELDPDWVSGSEGTSVETSFYHNRLENGFDGSSIVLNSFDYFDGDYHPGEIPAYYRFGVSETVSVGDGVATSNFCAYKGGEDCEDDYRYEVYAGTGGGIDQYFELGEFSWLAFSDGMDVWEQERLNGGEIMHGSFEYSDEGGWQEFYFEDVGFDPDFEGFSESPVLVTSLKGRDGEDFVFVEVDEVSEDSFEARVCDLSSGSDCEGTGSSETISWLGVSTSYGYEGISAEGSPNFIDLEYNTRPIVTDVEGADEEFSEDPVLNVSFKDFGSDPVSGRFFVDGEPLICDRPDCSDNEKVKSIRRGDVGNHDSATDSSQTAREEFGRGDETWIAAELNSSGFVHGTEYEWNFKFGEYDSNHFQENCADYQYDLEPLACYFNSYDGSTNFEPDFDYMLDEDEWESEILYHEPYELDEMYFEIFIPPEITGRGDYSVYDSEGEEREDEEYEIGDEVVFRPNISHESGVNDALICGDSGCRPENVLCGSSSFDSLESSEINECTTTIGEDWDGVQEFWVYGETGLGGSLTVPGGAIITPMEIFYLDSSEVSLSFESDDFVVAFIGNDADYTKTFDVELSSMSHVSGDEGSVETIIEGDRSQGYRSRVEVPPRSVRPVRINFRAITCPRSCEGLVELSVFDRTDMVEQDEEVRVNIERSEDFFSAPGVKALQLAVLFGLAVLSSLFSKSSLDDF